MKKTAHKTKKSNVTKSSHVAKKHVHPLKREVHPAVTFIVLGSSSFFSLVLLFIAISIHPF